jgi:hypothetical protein
MLNAQFIVQNNEQQQIEFVDGKKRLKLFAGQAGTKFTCDSYCSTLGRGHVHLLPCTTPHDCGYDSEISLVTHGRRHRGDFTLDHVDELRHDKYWMEAGFEDPMRTVHKYTSVTEFNLCRVTRQADDNKCSRHVGHDKLDTSSQDYLDNVSLLAERFESGTFSPSGHHFDQIGATTYHHYILIDTSKNMTNTDASPSLPIFHSGDEYELHTMFNNRFGCAVEFALRYLHIRYKLSPSDRMTVILFNRKNVQVVMENESTSHYYALLDIMVDYAMNNKFDQKSPKYVNAFDKVLQLVSKSQQQHKIILLSGPKIEEKKRKSTLGSFVSGIPKWKSSKNNVLDNDVLGDSKANRKLAQIVVDNSVSSVKKQGMTSSTSLPSLSSLALPTTIVLVKIGTTGNDNKINRFGLVAKSSGLIVDESLIRSNISNDPTIMQVVQQQQQAQSNSRIKRKDESSGPAHLLEHVIMTHLLSQVLQSFEHNHCVANENILNGIGGLLVKSNTRIESATSPDAIDIDDGTDDALKKDLIERDNLAREILSTERTYVTNLKLLIDLYQIPLSKYQTSIVSEQDRNSMFSGLMNIYGLHKNLLSQLETRMASWDKDQKIGDIFVTLGPMFLVYTHYTTKYENAAETFTRCRKASAAFRRFLHLRRKDPYSHGHTLNSFMILPVQRIPRYRMLLEGLIKYTTRTNPEHCDTNDLQQALKQMTDIAESLNAKLHEKQNLFNLKKLSEHLRGVNDLIQPNRVFIRYFKVRYLLNNQYHDSLLFLFNDLVIHTDAPVQSSTKRDAEDDNLMDMDLPEMVGNYDTRVVFNLCDVRLHPLNYSNSPMTINPSDTRHVSFQLVDLAQKVYEYACTSEKDKHVLVNALTDAMDDDAKRKRTFVSTHNVDRFQRISAYSFDFDAPLSPQGTRGTALQQIETGLSLPIEKRKNKSAPSSPHEPNKDL